MIPQPFVSCSITHFCLAAKVRCSDVCRLTLWFCVLFRHDPWLQIAGAVDNIDDKNWGENQEDEVDFPQFHCTVEELKQTDPSVDSGRFSHNQLHATPN